MCRAVLCGLLVLPHLALAQDVEEITPPRPAAQQPQSSPPPATPPAPPLAPRPRYSRHRTSWYIGFGFGAGAGRVEADSGDINGGGFGMSLLRVGWVARPWLLLGLEISSWLRIEGDLFFDSRWIQFLHYDLVCTVFPLDERGFYAKGGLGGGVATVDNSTVLRDLEPEKHNGVDIRLGLGYEWQTMTSFNLGADLSYVAIVAAGAQAHEVTAQLTFTWY